MLSGKREAHRAKHKACTSFPARPCVQPDIQRTRKQTRRKQIALYPHAYKKPRAFRHMYKCITHCHTLWPAPRFDCSAEVPVCRNGSCACALPDLPAYPFLRQWAKQCRSNAQAMRIAKCYLCFSLSLPCLHQHRAHHLPKHEACAELLVCLPANTHLATAPKPITSHAGLPYTA